MKIFNFFILLMFFFMVSSVNAGVYKWTDKEGNVHYSDQPVEKNKATELNINTNAATGVTNSAGNNKERDRMIQELVDDREAREKSRQEKRAAKLKKQKRCALAKDHLRRYKYASSVYKLNANGDRVYYSNEERAAKEKRLNKTIARNCR